MNDKTSESDFQEIIHRRSSGDIGFAQFLDELSKIGIHRYEIDVATGQAVYKGIHSEFKTDSQVNLTIADKFNRNKVMEAIANISLPFMDFLKEISNAGVAIYRVYIDEKKVEYIGMNGEVIEERLNIE